MGIISKIYLDLDDVLNCCTMDALRYVGCPVGLHDIHLFDCNWGWDIVRAANELHPTKTFTMSEFWQAIRRDFWATVPKARWCDELIERCASLVGQKNVCILSCPMFDPDCLAGKLEWIHENTPPWLHRQYLLGPDKQHCASHRTLLIDDRERNVYDFRAAGGKAIIFPRPWNCLHGLESPMQHVVRSLDCLQFETP